MNKVTKYFIWPVFLAPAVYLAAAWNKIPETVPLHYNLKGEADRFGSKSELLILLAVMVAVNVGVYFLLVNINRIDPKKKYREENLPRMRKLAFLISIFLSALTCFIIYTSMQSAMKFDSKFITIGLGLLFTVIGNYIYNIKPNYFAGIRTPWALENEENWRLTHKLGGKLWFVGGLVLVIAALLLPDEAALVAMLITVAILAIIPIVYSYRLYRKEKMRGADNGST